MPGPVQVQSPVAVRDLFFERSSRQVGRRRIFVQTDEGDVVGLELDRADKAEKVKKTVQAALRVPTEQSALLFGGQVLEDLSQVRNDAPVLLTRGIQRSCSSPCLSPQVGLVSAKERSKPLEAVGGLECCPALKKLMEEACKAIENGVAPGLAAGGLGGAYYFRDCQGKNVAIVKPTDEEPFAPNNPNGYVGRVLGQPGLKRTIRVGEAGPREVAAYLLDHEGFACVPHTAMVMATHPIFNVNDNGVKSARDGPVTKIGSFQQYVEHDFDASEHGTSRFPVGPVHRIGILDVRLFNTDRHSGNILVRRLQSGQQSLSSRVDDPVELIPIDHGFCLPETLESAYFEWQHWPQASLPFSQEELEYIASLDVDRDVDMLRAHLPVLREGCLRILVLSTTLLQRAAAAGFTLAEIAGMMSRELRGMDEEASELESLCQRAKERLEEELTMSHESDMASSEGSVLGTGGAEDEDDDVSSVQFQFDTDQDESAEGSVGGLDRSCKNLPESWTQNHSLLNSPRGRSSATAGGYASPFTPTTSSSSTFSQGSSPSLLPLEEGADEVKGGAVPSPRGGQPSPWFMPPPASDCRRTVRSSSLKQDPISRVSLFQNPALRSCSSVGVSRGPWGRVKAPGTVEKELSKVFPPEGGFQMEEMSDRKWSLFLDIVKELIDEALARRKHATGLRAKRFGTSCRF